MSSKNRTTDFQPITKVTHSLAHQWWKIGGLTSLALLLFVRNPYVVIQPQFWQEDATVFLVQQRTEGLMALFRPYAGYLLLYPRIIAAVAGALLLELTPIIYLAGAYIGWIWVGTLILSSSLFASSRWAFFAALAWVGVPHGGEVFLILTNVQWPLAAGLVLLLAEDPLPRRKTTPWVFATMAALTGPFSIVLVPLAGWRLWQCKRSHHFLDPIALVTLIGAAIQFSVLFCSHRVQQSGSVDSGRLSLLLWIAVFPELFGTKGISPSDFIFRLSGTVAGIGGMAWSAWAVIPGAAARRKLIVGAGLILLSGLYYVLGTQGGAPTAFGGGQRYLFVPFALYIWALIAAWSYCGKGQRTWIYAAALLSVTGFYSAGRFISPRHQAADWYSACRLLKSGHSAEIEVSPFGDRVTLAP